MPGVKSTICELGCPDHNGIRQLAQTNGSSECKKSGWTKLGSALVTTGQDFENNGANTATLGFATASTGIGITLLGQPELGVPFLIGGDAVASFGGLVELAGLGSHAIGGLVLAFNGNSQPLGSAAAHGAQMAADKLSKFPDGAPSPYEPLTNAIAGSNPCP
jgi:hypothetical protein